MKQTLVILAACGVGIAALLLAGCSVFLKPTWVVFSSNRSGSYRLYAMKINGSQITPITTLGGVGDFSPDIHHGGRRIVFARDTGVGFLRLFTIDVDGTGLTGPLTGTDDCVLPAWNRSGDRIVFSFYNGSNWDVWEMDPDGTDFQRITSSPGDDFAGGFSPDGQHIVFYSDRDGDFDIYRCNANALESNVVALTTDPGHDLHPSYSPDGSKITFASDRTGAWEIFRMTSAGTSETQVTDLQGISFYPSYTPDSMSIVFSSNPNPLANSEIWRIRDDGTGAINLTNHADDDYGPSAARSFGPGP